MSLTSLQTFRFAAAGRNCSLDWTLHWTQHVEAAAVPLFSLGVPWGMPYFSQTFLEYFLKHELFNSFPVEDFFFLAKLQTDMETHRTSVYRAEGIPFGGQYPVLISLTHRNPLIYLLAPEFY